MSWDSTCTSLITSYPGLAHVAISDHNGTLYGNSHPTDFALTPDLLKKIVTAIQAKSFDALEVCGCRFIILRNDESHLIGKAGPKSLFAHLTPKLCIIGQAVDSDDSMNSGAGNASISKISDYYANSGW